MFSIGIILISQRGYLTENKNNHPKGGKLMNKYIKALLLSLLCSAQLFADRSDCFEPYKVTFINKSGGIADVKKTKGIRGASKNSELENNSSVKILIQNRGSEITVKAGPEGNKSSREIKFYSKDFRSHLPTVVLNQKGFSAEGFSQKPINFCVKIENQSGGIARILDTCDASGKGSTISDGKSITINVKPSSYIVVQAGPENQKIQTKIVFAEQSGDQPSITLVKRGFMSRGIQSRNLKIQAQRVPAIFKKHIKQVLKVEKVKNGRKTRYRRRAIIVPEKTEYINRHVRRAN